MTAEDTALVWAALSSRRPEASLKVPTIDGRLDLRGLVAPDARVSKRSVVAGRAIEARQGIVTLRDVRWKGIDFSGARLPSLRFFDCSIEGCKFDSADCPGWRMWGTQASGTSFVGANLRQAALGGVDGSKRNLFRSVDFSAADLRQTSYVSAEFVGCVFRNTNLKGVDFQGSVFVDCSFEGELREVLFYREGFTGKGFPPNQMKGVDFRKASLRHVEFRGLDMDGVRWPDDSEHILIQDYVAGLDRALAALRSRSDVGAKKLAASLAICRKWVGPHQRQGVLNKRDLDEAGGPGAAEEIARLTRMN